MSDLPIFFPLNLMIFLGIGLLGTLFWVWMLIDCAMNEKSQGNERLVWVIIIVFTQLIGALIYYFVRRPRRIGEAGR